MNMQRDFYSRAANPEGAPMPAHEFTVRRALVRVAYDDFMGDDEAQLWDQVAAAAKARAAELREAA